MRELLFRIFIRKKRLSVDKYRLQRNTIILPSFYKKVLAYLANNLSISPTPIFCWINLLKSPTSFFFIPHFLFFHPLTKKFLDRLFLFFKSLRSDRLLYRPDILHIMIFVCISHHVRNSCTGAQITIIRFNPNHCIFSFVDNIKRIFSVPVMFTIIHFRFFSSPLHSGRIFYRTMR